MGAVSFGLGYCTRGYVSKPRETVVVDTAWLPTPVPEPIILEGPATKDTVVDSTQIAKIQALADSLRFDNTALVARLQEKRFEAGFDTSGVQGSVAVSYRPLDEWFRVDVDITGLPPRPVITKTVTVHEPAWVKPVVVVSTVGAVLFAQDKQYLPAAACATVVGLTLSLEL